MFSIFNYSHFSRDYPPPALAKSAKELIEVTYRDIKICVDGVEMTPKDSADKQIEPFVYNGTTYLPVRAISEAIGKEVTWDSSSNTVFIGKSGVTNYLGQQVTAYETNGAKHGTATMGGKNYYNSVWGDGVSDEDYAYYNLDGNFSWMSGVYGVLDGYSQCNPTILIYGDGRLLKTLECKGGELPQNFTINVTGVTQLKIVFLEGDYYGCLGEVSFT